jgi:hypothetical protein
MLSILSFLAVTLPPSQPPLDTYNGIPNREPEVEHSQKNSAGITEADAVQPELYVQAITPERGLGEASGGIQDIEIPEPSSIGFPEGFQQPFEVLVQGQNQEGTQPSSNFSVEGLELNYEGNFSKGGGDNQIIESSFWFRLNDREFLGFGTGLNMFDEADVETIVNTPIRFSWTSGIDPLDQEFNAINRRYELPCLYVRGVCSEINLGIDLFDRLSPEPSFDARIIIPITSTVKLAPALEYGAYKFNATTLENQITQFQVGADLDWDLSPETSLSANFRWGDYNDGNSRTSLFVRLGQEIGEFSIAANVFNLSYQRDVQESSGYFSPPDFLIYEGEIAWERTLFDELTCRLAARLGQQRIRSNWDTVYAIQPRCTLRLSPRFQIGAEYEFSNVDSQITGESVYFNHRVLGRLEMKF